MRDDAIVKIELGPQQNATPFEDPATYSSDPTKVGLQPCRLTGMIQNAQIGVMPFAVRSINGVGRDLHKLPVPLLTLDPADYDGADDADFVTFRVSDQV